jgi:hypothetical protein
VKDNDRQHFASVARIAGAMAHEVNNPLQGVLTHLSVLSRESAGDPGSQVRIEQIRSGLARITRIVKSFSFAYEHMPRRPDLTTISEFVSELMSSLTDRQLRGQVSLEVSPDLSFHCMGPELAMLIADSYTLPAQPSRTVQVRAAQVEDQVHFICESTPPGSEYDNDSEFHKIDAGGDVSGLAVLINEIALLSGGEAEFRYGTTTLSGIRLAFPVQMS